MLLKHFLRRLTTSRRKLPPDSSDLPVAGQQVSNSTDGRSAVYVGLDFGTSFSKVVVGGTTDRYAVPFARYAGRDNPCLLPSCLRVLSDGKKCALGEDRTQRGNVSDLKMPLIQRDFSGQARARAAAYLALVLQHTRDWLLAQDHGVIYRNRQPQWHVNVGLPTESVDDNELKDAYLSIVRSAWRLSCRSEEVTLPAAQRCISQDDSRRGGVQVDIVGEDMPDDRFAVFPEFAAQIAGYVRSPLGRDGLHANVDVGGGTLDFTVFNVVRANGEFRYPIFDRRVKPLGVRYLLAERFKMISANHDGFCSPFEDLPSDREFIAAHGLSEVELGQLDASFRKNVQETIAKSLQYVKNRRDPRAPHWMPGHLQYGEGLRSFFCGGGVLSDFYGGLLREFEEKQPALKLRPVKLEQPTDLKMPDGQEIGYARLAVAYGLAQDPYNLGSIKPMSKIDDEHPDPPRPAFGDAYIGKELT